MVFVGALGGVIFLVCLIFFPLSIRGSYRTSCCGGRVFDHELLARVFSSVGEVCETLKTPVQ